MNKLLKLALVASVAVAFLSVSTEQPLTGDTGQVNFKFSQSKKIGAFPYETLKGEWISCSGGSLKIEGKAGPISVYPEKRSIQVDTLGDGSRVIKIKMPGGIATVLTADSQPYAIELKNTSTTGTSPNWVYRRAGFMFGAVDGVRVTLIDDNSNGKYNDLGTDAIIVGKSKFAAPLGKMIVTPKGCYDVSVNADGSAATFTKANPTTGRLDMVRKFNARGKLAYVVISNGDSFFDMASISPKAGMPVGEYKLIKGKVVARRAMSCEIQAGKMPSISVSASEDITYVEWGGDPARKGVFHAEISATRSGKEVTCHMNNFHVFGVLQEEYTNFTPTMFPVFEIAERNTKRKISTGRPCTT